MSSPCPPLGRTPEPQLGPLLLLFSFSSPVVVLWLPFVLLLSSSCPSLVLLLSSSCPALVLLLSFACEPRVFLLLPVTAFSNPVRSPGVPRCPRATPCPSLVVCPGLPVLLVHVVGPFITTSRGACPLHGHVVSPLCLGMFSRGYGGYECNSDTAIEMRYHQRIFARHMPGSPSLYLQSFPPTLEFSELTPTATKNADAVWGLGPCNLGGCRRCPKPVSSRLVARQAGGSEHSRKVFDKEFGSRARLLNPQRVWRKERYLCENSCRPTHQCPVRLRPASDCRRS